MAGTTYGNALEAADWAHTYHLRTLIIVTADYHMPRAMLEMRRHLPGITLIPAPVRPPAMNDLFSLLDNPAIEQSSTPNTLSSASACAGSR